MTTGVTNREEAALEVKKLSNDTKKEPFEIMVQAWASDKL